MSKRHRSDDEGGPRSRRSRRRRHHLYLVVDDWSKGYSIYKVDVADFDGGDPGADLDSQANRLPDPPVFRLECDHDRCRYASFAAVGTRVVAMRYSEEDAPVLLYDTATGGLAVGPRTPVENGYAPELFPVCDRLYVMDPSMSNQRRDHFVALAADEKGGWVWNAVGVPPFNMRLVDCHAAHPDGRTIFFSAHRAGTYSFDTETHEWKRHGVWMLPFRGRAYYDDEVDAWVGLDREREPGTVCSCNVVSAGDDGDGGPPVWNLAMEKMACEDSGKLAKEKMVCKDSRRTRAVALTHMGRGKFCLVEHRSRKGVPADVLDSRYLFYATTFRLRYGKDGELQATARRTRSYTAPRESGDFNWWVFGI